MSVSHTTFETDIERDDEDGHRDDRKIHDDNRDGPPEGMRIEYDWGFNFSVACLFGFIAVACVVFTAWEFYSDKGEVHASEIKWKELLAKGVVFFFYGTS